MNEKRLIKPSFIDVFVIKKTEHEVKYLMLKRCSKYLHGTWKMVSGGCEEQETTVQTVLREIAEETGLTVKDLYSADFLNSFYQEARDAIIIIPVFVAFVESEQVKLSPTEHDEYKWVNFEDTL